MRAQDGLAFGPVRKQFQCHTDRRTSSKVTVANTFLSFTQTFSILRAIFFYFNISFGRQYALSAVALNECNVQQFNHARECVCVCVRAPCSLYAWRHCNIPGNAKWRRSTRNTHSVSFEQRSRVGWCCCRCRCFYTYLTRYSLYLNIKLYKNMLICVVRVRTQCAIKASTL